jgi:hypothetical protein
MRHALLHCVHTALLVATGCAVCLIADDDDDDEDDDDNNNCTAHML